MATEQELAAANARIAQFEKQEGERAKTAAVANALSGFEFVSDAAREQVQALIVPTVQTLPVSDGSTQLFGPNYKSLDSHIAGVLASPNYQLFLRPKGSPAPAQAAPQGIQPAAPVNRPANPTGPEIVEPKNFGEAIVMKALAEKAAQATGAEPRMNPAKPFGLSGTKAGSPALGPMGMKFH
jgi:hypothetical protein